MSSGAAALSRRLASLGVPCELHLPSGHVVTHGTAPPAFRMFVRAETALDGSLTEFGLANAYIQGHIDVEGDVTALLAIRNGLRFGTTIRQKARLAGELALRTPLSVNARAVRHHYSYGDAFYHSFLDTRYHFYSQCVFDDDSTELEEAAERKVERMWDALQLEPGMRLLDIGGGWGGVAAYCAPRGVHVTSLTISRDSAQYMRTLIRERGLNAEVVEEDMLEHRPADPYDRAVIFGVIEHIPTYRRFCARLWDALKPGARVFLDASATKEKYAASAFARKYIWEGPHSCLALPDLLQELLFHGFEVVDVRRETHDYELTMRHWAERFDQAHDFIARGWGETLYRIFRIFLWGGAAGFASNRLQAYSLVAERRPDMGPRPRLARRAAHFIASLR